MNIRLNKEIRSQIVQNALDKAGITAELDALKNERRQWSEAVRVHINGATDAEIEAIEKEAEAVIARLPRHLRNVEPGIVSRGSCDYVNLGGISLKIEFEDDKGRPEFRVRTALDRAVVAADHPLTKQFHDMDKREAEITGRLGTLKAQVIAIVNSATTVKKLLELWPEAAELIPPKAAPVSSNLPAVVVSDLNSMIGLPSDGGEA